MRKAEKQKPAKAVAAQAAERPPAIARREDVPSWVNAFWPQFSRILPNGNLRMNVSGVGEAGENGLSGEKLDGALEISPEFPDYEKWKHEIVKAERTERGKGATLGLKR